jgi:cell division septation protein DedD
MNMEMTSTACPLCKRAIKAYDHYPVTTRLCGDCQQIVHTIMPKRNLGVAAAVPAERLYAAVAAEPVAYAEEFIPESVAPPPFETAAQETEHWEVTDLPPEVETEAEVGSFHEDDAPASSEVWPEARPYDQDEDLTAAVPQEPGQSYSEATDPWDDPLPVWDISKNEWPMLAPAAERSALSRMQTPMVIVLLAACAAIAFLIYRYVSSTAEADQPAAQTAAAHKAAAPTATRPQAEAAPAGLVHTPAPQATAQSESAEGRLTLQIASFPNESAAGEYSARLLRAGIESYVVPADLSRRGKWWRVRIGRFGTVEQANQHAAETRARAKAAGLNLEMIVVDYEKY